MDLSNFVPSMMTAQIATNDLSRMVPMALEQFTLPFSQPAVEDLRDRLERTRWPDEVQGSEWEYGFNLKFLQEICG